MTFTNAMDGFLHHVGRVLRYPLDPEQRVFILYLLSSAVVAMAVYRFSAAFRQDRESGRGFFKGLVGFLFPKSIWSHRSAWVDVKYFLPHQIVRLWIYTDVLMIFYSLANSTLVWLCRSITGLASLSHTPNHSVWVILGFSLSVVLLVDFVSYVIHYFQHKVPLLWEFHKVHHSAEVLHPLSNYREHPVDNFSYAMATGAAAGCVTGVFEFGFGSKPLSLLVPILGVSLATFIFNFAGYHLRHSHVWIRWPGPLAYFFGCPAHHQIHHSCKPQHINKNFAFMFPIWDVIFRTYYLPAEQEEMVMGIGDGTEGEYKGIFSIYTRPFRMIYQRVAGKASRALGGLGRKQMQPK